jgi:hypothetical protein
MRGGGCRLAWQQLDIVFKYSAQDGGSGTAFSPMTTDFQIYASQHCKRRTKTIDSPSAVHPITKVIPRVFGSIGYRVKIVIRSTIHYSVPVILPFLCVISTVIGTYRVSVMT